MMYGHQQPQLSGFRRVIKLESAIDRLYIRKSGSAVGAMGIPPVSEHASPGPVPVRLIGMAMADWLEAPATWLRLN
jgi:hypothetical protein